MRKGFTFGYKKSLKPIELTPGPADYGLSSLHDSFEKPSMQMKLSNSSRFQMKKEMSLTPGPGSYDPREIPSTIRLPSISRSQRDGSCFIKSKGIPGPGKYNVSSKIGLINQHRKHLIKPLTISCTQSMLPKTITPGPGSYSINESFYKSNHSIKILQPVNGKYKTPSFIIENRVPGPNNYIIKGTPSGPKFTFGTKYEFGGRPKIQPGPDSYNVNLMNTSGAGKKFFRNGFYSFSKSTKGKNTMGDLRYFPGPGSYNLRNESPLLKENCAVFNTAIRPLFVNTERSLTPGPGSYLSLPSLIHEKKKGYSISKNIKNRKFQRRFKRKDSFDSIEEEEKKQKEFKKQEFLGRLKENYQQFGTPKNVRTPVGYEQPSNFKKALRRINSDSEMKLKPAPMFGPYQRRSMVHNIMQSSKNQKFPIKSFSIGKSIRKLEYLDPGNVSPNIQRSPGPAGYFLERKLDKKAIKIATSKRDDKFLVLNVNPGAGTYNYENTSFIKRPKKKKKLNPNLVKLLTRIQLKVHPEKKKSEVAKSPLTGRISKNKKFNVIVIKK